MNDLLNHKLKLRIASLLIIFSYILAACIAIFIGYIFSDFHPLLMVLFADIAATLVIFFIGTIIKNASFYDPYWSVAPLIICLYWCVSPFSSQAIFLRQIIIFLLVLFWSTRLTYNWKRQWRGLKHEDWRYSDLRKKMGKNFWFVNLTGIMLMPTIIVYLGCLSLYPALSAGSGVFSVIDILALFISGGAIIIESLADQQLYKFIKSRENFKQIIKKGLWKYSKHPNYLGEIMFWWGLYLFAIAADFSFWWTIIGPISITFLFFVISIPLIEKRNLSRKPEYEKYKKTVSKLIPWFPKKINSVFLVNKFKID